MALHRFAILSLSCFVAVLLATSEADARGRHSRAPRHAPKSGHVERTTTRTGPDGSARTSSHDTTWQRGEGQWSRDTVHTGPKGQQGTTHVEGAKTDDGFVRDVTRTRPDGATATTHDEVHRGEDGTTRDTTRTRPNGSTSSTQVIRHVTPVTDPAAEAQ